VAQYVANGHSNREIAARLGISIETVKAHVRDISRRIDGVGRQRYRILFFVLDEDERRAA